MYRICVFSCEKKIFDFLKESRRKKQSLTFKKAFTYSDRLKNIHTKYNRII